MTTLFVPGLPAPQGSKRYVGNGISVESSKRVKPWRSDVREAAQAAFTEPLDGPLTVTLTFILPRPKGHFRTGRYASELRDAAPGFPAAKPDVDKLIRAVLDALTHVAYADDAQVVSLRARKIYPNDVDRVGLRAGIWHMPEVT